MRAALIIKSVNVLTAGPSTLPRTIVRSTEIEMPSGRDKMTSATSSASLYDNVNNPTMTPGKTPKAGDSAKQKEKQNETCQTTPKTATVGSQASVSLN